MREHRDNLTKRCACSARQQLTCSHGWHIDFYRGRKFRYSLDVIAKARGERPPRNKKDAETLRDTLRGEIKAGTSRTRTRSRSRKPNPTRVLPWGT